MGVRLPRGIDAQRAFDHAADAGALMPVQIGAAARGKRHTVTAPDKFALGQRIERHGELRPRAHSGAGTLRDRLARMGELPAPHRGAGASACAVIMSSLYKASPCP